MTALIGRRARPREKDLIAFYRKHRSRFMGQELISASHILKRVNKEIVPHIILHVHGPRVTIYLRNDAELDELRQLLRIGFQYNTQVTLNGCKHLVSQVYCSALPIAYCTYPISSWEAFARLVLEASYESTLCAAILNSRLTGNNKVFLTFVGGGIFGNPDEWITGAIERALMLYKDFQIEDRSSTRKL